PFTQAKINLLPGDLLVIYSDGVTEALNAQDEEFGEANLIDLIRQHKVAPPAELIDKIVQAVSDFVGDMPQSDDITVVAIRREN
ncbi:MAG: serine/threonine-protein phosphatase, partial [Calditrichaeota bacterium]